jgi:hypothetical protein
MGKELREPISAHVTYFSLYSRRAGGRSTRDNSLTSQPPADVQRQSHFCLRESAGSHVVLDNVREAATDSLFEITGARTSTKIKRMCVNVVNN